MKKEIFVLSILLTGLITLPAFAADGGCCGTGAGAAAQCPMMSSYQPGLAVAGTAANIPSSISAVFENYIHIQTALADDSLSGVAESAGIIAQTIRGDERTTFSTNVTYQADAVAKAKDLPSAREAFKSLSQSLIGYVSKSPALAGSYRQVHCPMADASWLQTAAEVRNPYLGKSMLHCGQFVMSSLTSQGNPSMQMH